ncbi:helix-turn-helix domain-containing protein, partial [Geminocystis sp. CENA526]
MHKAIKVRLYPTSEQ